MRDALKVAGMNVVPVPKDLPKALNQFGGLIISPSEIDLAEIQPLTEWVNRGGMLICGMPGWGFLYNKTDKTLGNDLVAQRLFEKAGLMWGEGTCDQKKFQPATGEISPMFFADKVIETAIAYGKGEQPTLSKADAKIFGDQVATLGWTLPPTKAEQRKQLVTAIAAVKTPIPSPKAPLTESKHPLERTAIRMEAVRRRGLAPEEIKADPAAATFPGAVPNAAQRVTESVAIDLNVPNWHGTGLYAAPGEIVEVTIPADAVKLGLDVQIGNCVDKNYERPAWTRSPEISAKTALKSLSTKIACAFGGPVYILVPNKAPMKTLDVKVANVVRMPRYVLGKTDLKTWRESIRNAPGPWADLEGSRVILSVPSANIRELDDPQALMEWWDVIVRTQDELIERPNQAMRRPERIVCDEQISAGYMHAGYPIMCPGDVRAKFVDVQKMKAQGDWGIFHELGHNHQWKEWTYEGTGEVTVNIFSMYTFDTLHPNAKQHDAVSKRDATMAKMWSENGPPDNWRRDLFYAVFMFADLKDAYEWPAFHRFFELYKRMPDGERPKTDLEKHDGWLVNFSTIVGQNIQPLMDAYGVTTSEAAKSKVAHLPKMDLTKVKQRATRGQNTPQKTG
ncbi:MAG: M60 family metallopeptidase [Pirellulales bacterium]